MADQEGQVQEHVGPEPGEDMDSYIIRSSVSSRRKDALLRDYLDGREQCRALEAALERVGALTRIEDWDDSKAIGVQGLVLKGPFVEGSNFADYRGWQFALATERFLLKRFEEAIQESMPPPSATTSNGWADIFSAVNTLSGQIDETPHPRARLIVIAGRLNDDWLNDLVEQPGVMANWELDAGLKKTWILGTFEESLILHIVESDEPAVYVLNAATFATLTEFGSPRLDVNELTDEEVIQIANRDGMRRREVRLRVGLRLYESWELERRQGGKAVGMLIEAPG